MAEPFSTMQNSRRKRTSTRNLDDVFGLLEGSDDENNSLDSGSDIESEDFELDNENLSISEEESGDEDASHESSKDVNESDEVAIDEESSDNDTDEGRTDSVNKWTLVKDLASDKPPVINDFTSPCGPLQAEPVEYFSRFFAAMGNRQSLWDFLVAETNKYFQWHLNKLGVLQKSSKMHLWKPLTVEKLRAFLGLLLNMGLVRKHKIEEYWNTTNYFQDTPMFRKVMKLNTFKLILRFIHASDSNSEPKRGSAGYDPQYKFRQVLEHLNATWAQEYNLHCDISIDEIIVGFKGRHVLVNYIKIKKHHQWGPKEYNLADSKTGYVHQTMYHTTGAKKSKFGQPYDVCDKLLANHGGKNHHLVVDNYYTSIDLAEQMLLKEIYITGTIRRNRRNLPPLVQKKAERKAKLLQYVRDKCLH